MRRAGQLALLVAAALGLGAPAAESGAPPGATQIVSIGVDGHARRSLGSASGLVSMSPDRTKVAFLRGGELWVMNADGSARRRLLAPGEQEAFADESFLPPSWSPGSARLALDAVSTAGCGPGDTKCADWYVVVADLKGRRLARIDRARNLAWSPTGKQLVYEQGEDGGFSLTPEATQIAISAADGSAARSITSEIAHGPAECWAVPGWSPEGSRISYEAACNITKPRAYVSPVAAGERHVIAGASHLAWSPSGAKLAFLRGPATLVVTRGDGTGTARRFATSAGPAVWSPEGSRLAFVSRRTGQLTIVDEPTGQLHQITQEPAGSLLSPLAFSRDGKRLFYTAAPGNPMGRS